MILPVLGIDVGKRDFYCALTIDDKVWPKSFPNSKTGFGQLRMWLRNRKVDRVHACLEATGGWSEELALDLHESGHAVSLVNPLAIKAFGQSELSRTKTDKADAALIARYCAAMKPAMWQPPSPTHRRLQQLARRRMALDEMRQQERNRLEGPGISEVAESIQTTVGFLSERIEEIDEQMRELIDSDPTLKGRRELLESIPGVGERLSVTLLGEIPNINEFRSGKALSAFVGLCPREFRSGTSASTSWLSRAGNARVRKILYMPAIVAMRCNPLLKAFAERLRFAGKRPMQIVTAVMRRLLIIAYGVLKSRKPFDPEYGCGRRQRKSNSRAAARKPVSA